MDLSIVIVNFRTLEVTQNCLASLKRHVKNIKWEVILVDNSTSEDNGSFFSSILPELVYLRSEENLGFGRANNLGITQAKGKYILLLNSDTIIFDDSLEKCYRFMEADVREEIGVLGCQLLNEDRSFQPSFYPFRKNNITNYLLTNNWLLSKFFHTNDSFKETNQVLQVGDVSGAFMFMRKRVVDEVKGFDPDFFLYCEETEWCRERIAKRFKIVYYPLAAIIHLGGKSAPKEPMYIQSKLSLYLLWYKKGWINYLLFIIFSYLNLLTHLILLPFVRKESKRIILSDVKSSIKVLPYLFTYITKYKRAWGSRKEVLIYEGARTIFFGSNKADKINTL